MEEHKLLDILIHFRTLTLTSEKIKTLEMELANEKIFDSSIINNLSVTRQKYLDKLLFLLESNFFIIDNNKEEQDLSQKLNLMSNLFGGEQIVESGNINPAVFDNFGNFGSGLARLLGGNTIQTNININKPSLSLYQDVPSNIIQQLSQNENFSFNLKKKSTNPLL